MFKAKIRRQWNDWRIAEVSFDNLFNLRWDTVSGGARTRAPQPFVHGYVNCDRISGDIAHSCAHGAGSHEIKVCVVKRDQSPEVWQKILSVVGPKPQPKMTRRE